MGYHPLVPRTYELKSSAQVLGDVITRRVIHANVTPHEIRWILQIKFRGDSEHVTDLQSVQNFLICSVLVAAQK